ncbi:MAG: hypothetical protein H6Q74_1229 [Firmicutes bacterium]|nr:hypothetical protein [Bacillota bacterium]
MKINNLRSMGAKPITDREVTGKPEGSSNLFTSELVKNQEAMSKERLNALLEKLDSQGKRLGDVPTYSELKAYRELVRGFLGEVVSQAYIVQSDVGWDRQGRQKLYSVIKEIDKHLTGLAEDVRVGQERQLNILAKVDAIRGMLVDLYG